MNPYDVVQVRWEATTTNTITLDFESTPNTNSKRVAIKGPGTKQFYSTTIGDGSNSTIVVNHNLGSRNVVPVVRNVDSPFEVVEVLSYATSINSVTFDFSTAPSSASLLASVYLLDVDNSYFTTVGNNSSTEFTITHNLDTRDIGVICRSAASPYEFIPIRWEATTVNTAKVIFAGAPTLNSRKIGIYKAVGGIKTFNDEVTLAMLDDVSVTTPSNGQFLSWDGTNWVNASAPGGAGINLLAIGSNIVPAVDNTYSLGNASLRWQSISIGGGTIFITDSGNNNQVALTVNNGVFNIDGIAQAQLPNIKVTNLTFNDNTVQTTAARSIPNGGSTGQFLVKTNETDYNVQWSNVPAATNGIPVGGVTNQLLAKLSDTNYDVQWINEAPAASYTSQVKHLVKNDDSVTLTKGMVVYTSGANGNNILVKRAIATSEITSSQVLGFIEANIAVDATGYVVNNGLISNIDTNSASAAGDPVWLSATTSGGVVYGLLNKPDAPNHLVYLGVVNRKNANNGAIFVHVSNGWELDEIHNVSAATPSSGDFLKYNGSVWVNDAINLGTDTVGDYISSLVAGTGITLANNSGEGATPTITVNTSVIATVDSPSFTGTPLAPTAANTTNNTQIATTAYVKTVIGDLINSAPATLDTLGEIATSLANNASLSSSLTSSIALKAPLADPTFTGTVTIPAGASISGFATLANATFTGNITLPATTSIANVSSTEIGYLDGVTSAIQTQIDAKAQLASPTFTGTVTGVPAAGTTSTGTSGFGYMGLPQNGATTGAYGIVAADAGTHIYSSATRTITIPANATIAMPIGSTIVFIAGSGATVTIAITSDTMYLAGPGTTGSRTLAAFGMATAVKITSTSWIISGNGLT